MQMSDAKKLKEMWNGSKCSHQDIEKEYYLGTATGDYVYTKCGEAGWGRDWVNKKNLEQEKDK